MRQPTVFVNHGGGPMPLMGKQPSVADNLSSLGRRLGKPSAVVIISAHYQPSNNDVPKDGVDFATVCVMTAPKPTMLYDYRGFSPEAYEISYPARNDAAVAAKVKALLTGAGLHVAEDAARGFDHGMFVPLKLMYPDADVPVVGLSLPRAPTPEATDSALHKMGVALAPLRDDDVLLLGSGATFHNFSAFFRPADDAAGRADDAARCDKWHGWLRDAVTASDTALRTKRLAQWRSAPSAGFAHPTDEHFTPLLVVAASAGEDKGEAIDAPREDWLYTSQFIFG